MRAKIEALLARASDPAASVEEQRTSAVIAAKLMREHKIVLGGPEATPPAAAPDGFRLLDRLLAAQRDPRVRAVVDDPRTRAVLSDLADRVLDSLLSPKPKPRRR